MEKKQFKIEIAAPREKVWKILWGDKTYPAWTSVFAEGSRAETDWEEGSKVLFLMRIYIGLINAAIFLTGINQLKQRASYCV